MQAEMRKAAAVGTVPAKATAPPARVWPAVVLVAAYWAASIVVGRLEKPYFHGFIFGMASAVLLTLLFFGWWWTRRQVRWRERTLGFLLIVVGGVVVSPLCHRSVAGFGVIFSGVPLALTAWALWMAVAKRLSLPLVGLGAVAAVGMSWGTLTLVRIDGLDADLRADMRWRWTPSAEDLFRQEQAATASESSPAAAERLLSAGPGDWVTFRGVERDGVIRGVTVAANWSEAAPRRLWKRRVGPAWSSVVVVGDRLFTQEQRGDNEAVVCYDAATGQQMWIHEDAARFWETVSGAGPRATPTFSNGRLYTLGATGLLTCLDAASGLRRWGRAVVKESAKPPQWGYSGSPLVVEDTVIVYAGGAGKQDLLAYRASSGELAWGATVGQGSYASPQLATLAGKRQILLLADKGLVAIDPATGEPLWEHGLAMPGAPRAVQAHTLGDSGLVVGTMSGTGVARIDVSREGPTWKVTERWATADLKPEFPDFVVHDGHAYGFDGGVFCCIELEGGARKWKGGRYGRGQVMLLADQPALLVQTEKGEAVLLAANPNQRKELGRFQAIEGKTWNHPVIAHGRLFVRNAEEMACYDQPSQHESSWCNPFNRRAVE